MTKRLPCPLFALVFSMAFAGCHSSPPKTTLIISSAASLKDAMTEVEAKYSQTHPDISVENNFASSGTLAQQIEQGAPVDLFLSAATKPMDELEQKNLLTAQSRRDLLKNNLVLVAPKDSSLSGFDGLTSPVVRVIALGDPASVPAGQYGEQTLSNLHLLDKVKSKFVLGKDVRQVLSYVETGNADAGIVYVTDAHIASQIRMVATAPDGSHDPIIYPVAVLKDSRHQSEAIAFANFLTGQTAKAIFEKYGFTVAAE